MAAVHTCLRDDGSSDVCQLSSTVAQIILHADTSIVSVPQYNSNRLTCMCRVFRETRAFSVQKLVLLQYEFPVNVRDAARVVSRNNVALCAV